MMGSRLNRRLGPAVAIIACALLAGCASGSAGSGFTGTAGGSCESLRKEMNGLIARGVVSQLEAQQAGRRLTPQAQGQVDRYNAVLEAYLGQQCQNH